MDIHQTFGIAAACASVWSTYYYWAAILRGETKPNRVTYWIWFAMSVIIFLAYRKSGGTTMWLQAMYVVASLGTGILSLKYGEGSGLSWLDKVCLALAATSIPLWWVLRERYGDTASAALPVLIVNLLADALGAVPTLEKAWNRPETEDRKAWLVCLLGTTLNLGAVTRWGAADIVWNGWMWGAALCYALFVYLRPPSTARPSET